MLQVVVSLNISRTLRTSSLWVANLNWVWHHFLLRCRCRFLLKNCILDLILLPIIHIWLILDVHPQRRLMDGDDLSLWKGAQKLFACYDRILARPGRDRSRSNHDKFKFTRPMWMLMLAPLNLPTAAGFAPRRKKASAVINKRWPSQ